MEGGSNAWMHACVHGGLDEGLDPSFVESLREQIPQPTPRQRLRRKAMVTPGLREISARSRKSEVAKSWRMAERTHRSENDVVAFPPEVRFPAGLLTGSVTASQKNCGVVVHTLKAGLQRASEARHVGESPDRFG